jgi:hypothetical protein
LGVLQLGFALGVSAWLGILPNFEEVIFSTPDSQGYRAVSEWLCGQNDGFNLKLFTLRPFFYPLFLASRVLVGDLGIVLLQLALNSITTGLLFLTVWRLVRSTVVATLATFPLLTNLTFGLIAFHALSETLSMFLLTAHLFFLVHLLAAARRSSWEEVVAGVSISLAVCTKPAFLPYWLFLVTFAVWESRKILLGNVATDGNHHRRTKLRIARVGLFLVAGSPVLVQLSLTRALTGEAVLSVSGRLAIETRFFPVAYGMATAQGFLRYDDERAIQARREYPTLGAKLAFLAANPAAAARAMRITVWDMNWRSPSSFTSQPVSAIRDMRTAKALTEISRSVNKVYSWLHLVFSPLWLLVLVAVPGNGTGRRILVLVAVLNCSLLLGPAAGYAQGDRLILTAMPAWLLLYPFVLSRLLRRFRREQGSGSAGMPRDQVYRDADVGSRGPGQA